MFGHTFFFFFFFEFLGSLVSFFVLEVFVFVSSVFPAILHRVEYWLLIFRRGLVYVDYLEYGNIMLLRNVDIRIFPSASTPVSELRVTISRSAN
jgi:hypothetical protein